MTNLTALQNLLLWMARENREQPLGDGSPIDLRIDDFLSNVVFTPFESESDGLDEPSVSGKSEMPAAPFRAAVNEAIEGMSPQFVDVVYGADADHEKGVGILGFRLTQAGEKRASLLWAGEHNRADNRLSIRPLQPRSNGEHSQAAEMVVSGIAMVIVGILGTCGSLYLAEKFGAPIVVVAVGAIFSGLICLFKGLMACDDHTPVLTTELPYPRHRDDATCDRYCDAASSPSLTWGLFLVAACTVGWGVFLSSSLAAAYYFLRYGEWFPPEAVGFTVAAFVASVIALLSLNADDFASACSKIEEHSSSDRFTVACLAVFLVTVIEVLISIPMAYGVAGGNHPGRVIFAWLVVTTLLVGVAVYAARRVLPPRGTHP